jgi:hypothetical protein
MVARMNGWLALAESCLARVFLEVDGLFNEHKQLPKAMHYVNARFQKQAVQARYEGV